jgi:hypothetical protein
MNNHIRALRYRELATAELDPAKAALLNKIATEAEQDVLCTVDSTQVRTYSSHPSPLLRVNELALRVGF